MRARIVALCLALCCMPVTATAELYITDSVTVSLFPEADLKGEPVQSVISGTPVEVLERLEEVARVKTSNGGEGWVRVSLLMSSKPAATKLEQADKARKKLERELDALNKEIKTLKEQAKDAKDVVWMRAEMNKARDRAKQLEAEVKKLRSAQTSKATEEHTEATENQQALETLRAEKEDLEQRLAATLMIADSNREPVDSGAGGSASSPSYVVALIGLLLGLVLGGVLGYRWLDYRVRKRFCGVKVY